MPRRHTRRQSRPKPNLQQPQLRRRSLRQPHRPQRPPWPRQSPPHPPPLPNPPPPPAANPAAVATKPQHHSGWIIQVGPSPAEQAAKQRLSNVQTKASKMLTGAEPFTETVDKGGTTFYRARFAGLDKEQAEAACKYLKKNDVECVTVKN